MRALRVVVADGGLLSRADLMTLCERGGFDVVGESVGWDGIPDLIASRAADLLIVNGDPDFARGVRSLEVGIASLVVVAEASATKEYADSGASMIVTPAAEREVLWATAQMAVARAADLAASQREVERLRGQLETRKLVERAKGVLMRRLGVDEDTAYRRIQRASQDENRKMRDIAESILSAERLYTPPDADADAADDGASTESA